jgi:tetratricopeptide (TPR) repeat protein
VNARRLLVAALAACLAGASCSSCRRETTVPDEVWREAVAAFHTGLAALQTSQEPLARQKFERVASLVPQEAAAWANLGLLSLRQQDHDASLQLLAKAAELAPDDPEISSLRGLAEGRKGNPAEAIRHWRRTLQLEPNNQKAAYALAQELMRENTESSDSDAQLVLAGIVDRTGNLAARLELARLAAKRRDTGGLRAAIAPLTGASATWPAEAREQLAAVQQAVASDPAAAATRVAFLKNVLLRHPEFRTAVAAVSTPLDAVGEPIERLLALRNPSARPAPHDESLRFAVRPSANATWARSFSAKGEGAAALLTLTTSGFSTAGQELTAGPVRGVSQGARPETDHVAAADLNYDFMTDLVVADAAGLRLFQQQPDGRFADVTARTGLPSAVVRAAATGVWAADIDLDGDLDLVVARASGSPLALRNNSDGTFATTPSFPAVPSIRGFTWADLDGDGVPDATLLDATGAVHVLVNQRGFGFSKLALPDAVGPAVAVTAADVSGGTGFDLLLLGQSGTVSRLSVGAGPPQLQSLLSLDAFPPRSAAGAARLVLADLDNNGASDLIVSGPTSTRVLLRTEENAFRALPVPIDMCVSDAADLDGDGRLELVGMAGGRAATASSTGARSYRWQVVRPRAASAQGDQRINAFGIGGEIEVRTGIHAQTLRIASPLVHVGLGEAARADVVRIVWPNGVLQSEFDAPADAVLVATQRLKGSCPWLFAWDGRQMSFVTDLIWRSPLGLRINAQDTADVLMTEDRVRVPADRLVPRDGAYDLRITAELWETLFFDLVSLVAVDRPAGTEVFVDERFSVPPPRLEPVSTGPVQAFADARDDGGNDVASIVRDRDDQHLDFAGRGAYQGITREHFVELALPEDAPRSGPLWLVAQGWIHPTDSSVNVAISQGAHAPPRPLSLEVSDPTGSFRVVKPNLGFPAGKDKTVLVDLAGVFTGKGPRRLRLRTNLEVFWDRLGWAVGRPDVPLRIQRIALQSADLSYRGFSETTQQHASSPERPRYRVEGTMPRWLDLEGYYTRHGDVMPLLGAVDDRYVIMNAGDELRLRFAELPPPAPGHTRDFLVVSDGWVKDGDYNTTASRTVLPLPTHASGRYDRAPGRLEDDPVHRRHPKDFREYHTRYVTPSRAREALRTAGGHR